MHDAFPRESTFIAPPIPDSYWLPGGRLVAGEYPGSLFPQEARRKIGALLDAGVRTFVDLTTPHDSLEPYDTVLAEEAARREVMATRRAMPIQDMGVVSPEVMRDILALLDAEIAAGRTPYVHCWGGVGRTGLVVGCHLVRHGATGEQALEIVRQRFGSMSKTKVLRHGGQSPQTRAQLAMVRGWAEHDLHDGR